MIAEAAVVAEEVIVSAPEAVVETVESAAVRRKVIVPAPEAVVESAEVIAEVAVGRQRK